MTTPILSKKQQRHSLSAKKGPVKGLRNILAQPFENYWPVVNVDQYPTLVNLMNELLPLIKRPIFKISGSMLRHMTKEKRILVRKEEREKEPKPDVNLLKSVILGINAVTRALEKTDVCCILLDANIEPLFLIKHVIVMAQNKKVPVLLISVLKIVTLQNIGFATAALALKRNVMQSSDNEFKALYQLVAEISKDFQPPKSSLRLFKSDETPEEIAMHEAKITDTAPENASKEKPVILFTDVYRYRSSRKERAFIPPSSKNSVKQVSQTSADDFIAFSDDIDPVNDKKVDGKKFTNVSKNWRYVNILEEKKDESESTEKEGAKSFDKAKNTGNYTPKKRKHDDVTYLSLKVKRIQGNNNRKKATKSVKKKKKQ